MHVPRDDEGTPRDVKGCHQGMPTDGKKHPNLILAALKKFFKNNTGSRT